MKTKRFEDLIAWQKARELFRIVQEITGKAPIKSNYPVRDQMTRAALSIMSNIAEGFDRGGDKEFVQYLYISKGSFSELRSQLYAGRDAGYLKQADFDAAFELAEETSKIIQGLLNSIKSRSLKGRKFQASP